MRPTAIEPAEPIVRGYPVTHPPGTVVPPQPPGWDQLLFAASGFMTVETTAGTWVVPPHRAMWVPDGEQHRIVLSVRTQLRNLYFHPDLVGLPAECRAVDVPPLLRELLLHAVATAPLRGHEPADRRLAGVLGDLLVALPVAPLQLPMPVDPRAVAVAESLIADPGSDLSVTELARAAGASRRTIERSFLSDTGMSVGSWRQRLRLLEALRLLASGESVTRVAAAVGYSTPSAFGAMFRRETGTTPARYFD
jgi:AraC-like DNA-binding protein